MTKDEKEVRANLLEQQLRLARTLTLNKENEYRGSLMTLGPKSEVTETSRLEALSAYEAYLDTLANASEHVRMCSTKGKN